jgi:hypothetical protein
MNAHKKEKRRKVGATQSGSPNSSNSDEPGTKTKPKRITKKKGKVPGYGNSWTGVYED